MTPVPEFGRSVMALRDSARDWMFDFLVALPFMMLFALGLALRGWWVLLSIAAAAGLGALALRYYRRHRSQLPDFQWRDLT